MAVDTHKSNIVEVALDLIHKLIAFRWVKLLCHCTAEATDNSSAAGDLISKVVNTSTINSQAAQNLFFFLG